MKSFFAGLGIGLGLGILFAPMSGEETRNNIRDRANDLADQARDAMDQGRERVNRGIQNVRNMAGTAAERVNNIAGNTGTGTGEFNAGATGTEGV